MNNEIYAFKLIPKYNLDTIGRLMSLINEPNILKRFKNQNNFIPKIISYFRDYENMYIITTLFDGLTLFDLNLRTLSEKKIKFIISCLIISLKYIRKQGVIHRDITLKNIIIDKDYYFNLIDFSFAVDYYNRNNIDLKCNFIDFTTPPELINNSEIDYNFDYYRLGFIIFFLIVNKPPWKYNHISNITDFILMSNIKRKYSNELLDLLIRLFKKDIKERIGYKSIVEIQSHPWFREINFNNIEKKRIISPFKNIKYKKRNIICSTAFEKSPKLIENYINLTKEHSFLKIVKFFDN